MTQVVNPTHTLDSLDAMSIEQAQSLSFEERDALLDLIIADGLHEATSSVSHRTGLYTDYFEEDLTRMLKVRAVKVYVRGTTPSDFDGNVVGHNYMDQYRACFRHVETSLTAAKTSFSRVVNMVVFLTNMDLWADFNVVFREFVPNPPCRAVIGTTGLAQSPLLIEIVDTFAYRVAD
jgi:2-iminobutanoate/2-iminopropanoate deaminase